MKQRKPSHSPDFFSDCEKEVCEILRNLENLIPDSDSHFGYGFSFSWGARKRRSALVSDQSSPSTRLRPPSLTKQETTETERRPKVKPEATSPATPLSFSPSESDEKPKHSQRRNSKKRTREDLTEKVDELHRTNEELRKNTKIPFDWKKCEQQLETVKCFHSNQKAINSALKAKKHELEQPCLGMRESRMIHASSTSKENGVIPMIVHQQPLIIDRTGEIFLYGSGFGVVNRLGPLGIPDLNVSAEETFGVDALQPLDCAADNKARAAEARKRRMLRIREMKTMIKPPRFR